MSKEEIIYQLFIEGKISLTKYLELISKPVDLDKYIKEQNKE